MAVEGSAEMDVDGFDVIAEAPVGPTVEAPQRVTQEAPLSQRPVAMLKVSPASHGKWFSSEASPGARQM